MTIPLRHQVGQLIVAGLEGPELTLTERARLKLIQPGGVILFRRNIEEAGQTVRLLRETADIIGTPSFRCVDLEGGLVDRLRDLIAPMPSPAAVYATGKQALFKKHGRLIAQEARSLGFNAVFAPVLDLALPASANVMRTRAVSPDPVKVTGYAAAFLDGFASEGIIGCGKHFPGLGGGNLDSHHAMPVIQRLWEEMWHQDLVPFRTLSAALPMIMVAHAAYPKASGTPEPASISPFWITAVLRKKLCYRGLIISDDMEMGGILTQKSIEEAAVEAIAAGTDIVEICKDPSLVLRAYEALLAEAERSPIFRRLVHKASNSILSFKERRLAVPISRRQPRLERLRLEIKTFAQQIDTYSSNQTKFQTTVAQEITSQT
jgi:beta-N-acetylhexosaminidase